MLVLLLVVEAEEDETLESIEEAGDREPSVEGGVGQGGGEGKRGAEAERGFSA